jgi:hypothetical protein
VSYKLVEEVYEHMPPDLTLGDRALLVLLAHHADEQTRQCWPGMKKITCRTGMHAESIRRSLKRLVERGLVSRVGGPAMSGRSTVYRIGELVDRPNPRLGQPSTGATADRASPPSGKAQPSIGDRPNPRLGPEGHELEEPSNARESAPVDGWTAEQAKAEIRRNFTRRTA